MVCSSVWAQKELDTTERLNSREGVWLISGKSGFFSSLCFYSIFFFSHRQPHYFYTVVKET